MENFAAVQSKPKTPLPDEAWRPGLQDDPHWELAQRAVAAPQFARSPLLSKFLLHVVRETLEGRGDEITEHQIGVQVFDRPPDYRTLEDNIVRSYARQLRKRLAEHFADEGNSERNASTFRSVAMFPSLFRLQRRTAEKTRRACRRCCTVKRNRCPFTGARRKWQLRCHPGRGVGFWVRWWFRHTARR